MIKRINKFIHTKYEFTANVWYYWFTCNHNLRNALHLARNTL